MRQELIAKLVALAKEEVGTREDGGNNKGAHIVIYQKATWLQPAPWAWCAAFICWLIREWLKLPEVATYFKFDDRAAETWRPKTAGAFDFEKWALSKAATCVQVLPETALAMAGDLVIFDFSHIGIVVEDQKVAKTAIKTVEGNTNGKGDRDSVSGDGVWLKTRDYTLAKCFIRLIPIA